MSRTVWVLLLLAGCGQKKPAEAMVQPTIKERIAIQEGRVAQAERDRALEQVRLVSLALAAGDEELAEKTLRGAVATMQDFRADGQFAAIVGGEDRKQWKGEPYEKMMAFTYLGFLLQSQGDHGNALAMSKSALLADTGTRAERFQADFAAGWLLKALAFQGIGERMSAERAMDAAIHALTTRRLIQELSACLLPIEERSVDRGVGGAKALLLAGLPAGVTSHPTEPLAAIDGALSYATDLRQVVLQGSKKDRPAELTSLSRRELLKAFEHLERITVAWKKTAEELPVDLLSDLDAQGLVFRALLDDPSLILIIERGRGPQKVGMGRYGEVLSFEPATGGSQPTVTLDGERLTSHFLEDIDFQARSRGGRGVDGFLKGKAVFKDSSVAVGYSLFVAGDIASASDSDEVALVLYLAGALTWVGGALTNPAADTRGWEDLPHTLWVTAASPGPGSHELQIGNRRYTVDIPDKGTILQLIPRASPFGSRHFGEACVRCEEVPAAPSIGETP